MPVGYDYDATANDVFEIFLKKSCEYLRNKPSELENFVKEFLEEIENFSSSFKGIIEKVEEDCKFRKLFGFLGLNTRVYPLIIPLELRGWLDNSMMNIIEALDLRVYESL